MKVATVLALSIVPTVGWPQVTYKVYEIGPPGSSSVSARDMNSSQQFVGYATVGGMGKNFLGSRTGTYSYPETPSGFNSATVYSLSDSGLLVGFATGTNTRGCLWDSSGISHPFGPPPGYSSSAAYNVNNSGDATGSVYTNNTASQAMRWSQSSGYTLLPSFMGDSFGEGVRILDDRTVYGTTTHRVGSAELYRCVKWSPDGSMTELLPVAGFNTCQLFDANASGLVVGFSGPATNVATEWVNGTPIALHVPEGGTAGLPTSINSLGEVVGVSAVGACYWKPDHSVVDLNTRIDLSTPGWHLDSAVAIDDSGFILGWGSFQGRQNVPFVAEASANSVIHVDDVTVNLGYIRLGDFHSLNEIDNDSLQVAHFIVPNLPVRTVFSVTGVESYGNISGLNFVTYGKMGVAGSFSQTLELFNFSIGDYDPTDRRTDILGSDFIEKRLVATGDLSRYHNSSGLMRARVTVSQIGPSASSQWWSVHDKIIWEAVP